jgi:hypothetical protein
MSGMNEHNKRQRLTEQHDGDCESLCLLDLPDVLIKSCLLFVGPGHYRQVAGACHAFQDQYSFPKETYWKSAAASVSCAKFCLAEHLEMEETSTERVLVMLQREAARMGQVCVLQWAWKEHECECSRAHFYSAAHGGHLNVLQWANEKGMDWYSFALCWAAGLNGHVHVLDWIHRHHHVPEDAAGAAAKGGHVSVLQWMKDHSVLNMNNKLVLIIAAGEGHIDALQWMCENGWFINNVLVVAEAAANGHIAILEWARDNGWPWGSARACSSAAAYGRLDVLQWLRANGCPWDHETLHLAHTNGHALVFQWARDNGCPEPPA